MAEQIIEYEKSPQQKAADRIAEIKRKARADIEQVKAELHKELYGEDGSTLDKIFKKKLRSQHKEAKRIDVICVCVFSEMFSASLSQAYFATA